MKRLTYILSILILVAFFSCKQEKIDPGMAPNTGLAGAWTVNEYDLDMNEVYGPSHLYTYNTSFDADSIWVDNIYDSGIKIKAFVLSESAFSIDNKADFSGTGLNVTVSEAQVLEDSIIFRVTLYEEGNLIDDYYEAGHRTTGFGDDTH